MPLGILPTVTWKLLFMQKICTQMLKSNYINNRLKLEAIKMPFIVWMDKQLQDILIMNSIQQWKGRSCSSARFTHATWMNLKCILWWKKPDAKTFMVLFMQHPGKGKTIWIGSCQRMGVGEQQWLTALGDGTTLYSTRVADTQPYAFVKTQTTVHQKE